jgi:hypothetical protein
LVVPREELVRDLPLSITLEQSKYIGSSGIGAGQLTRPSLHFQMHDSDALDDFDACKSRIDIGCRSVCGDPLENVLHGATIFDSLTVAGDGCGRMKSRAHEFAIARASARNVAVHGSGNGVMFDDVSVGGKF